jgi:hypothetical protein
MGKSQARRKLIMKTRSWKLWIFMATVAVALVMFGMACATGDKGQEKSAPQVGEEQTHEQGEAEHSHEGEGEHSHSEEWEDSEERLALTDTYDHVRHGVRLVLAYHNASSSFVGSVENTTDKILKAVRVEVHLSTGVELGPTDRIDLAPGEKAGVKLEAKGHVFEWWKAHPETGPGERDHSLE